MVLCFVVYVWFGVMGLLFCYGWCACYLIVVGLIAFLVFDVGFPYS